MSMILCNLSKGQISRPGHNCPGQEEDGLTSAYGSGRGKVTVQARAHFEEMSRGRNRIIVTELPYMTTSPPSSSASLTGAR